MKKNREITQKEAQILLGLTVSFGTVLSDNSQVPFDELISRCIEAVDEVVVSTAPKEVQQSMNRLSKVTLDLLDRCQQSK